MDDLVEVEYTTLDDKKCYLLNEDDILGKMHESEERVVFCVVSNRQSMIFANADPGKIWHFIYQFRRWDSAMCIFECESYEDAYRTFFPMHESEELCYSKNRIKR